MSAIVFIVLHEKPSGEELPRLRQLVATNKNFRNDSNEYFVTRPVNDDASEHRTRMLEHQTEHDRRHTKAKALLVRLGDYVVSHLDQLRDQKELGSWKAGAFRLWHLNEWLGFRVGE